MVTLGRLVSNIIKRGDIKYKNYSGTSDSEFIKKFVETLPKLLKLFVDNIDYLKSAGSWHLFKNRLHFYFVGAEKIIRSIKPTKEETISEFSYRFETALECITTRKKVLRVKNLSAIEIKTLYLRAINKTYHIPPALLKTTQKWEHCKVIIQAFLDHE